MALIKCSECGKEISDKAASCPNCGNPINVHMQVESTNTVPYTNIQANPGKPASSFSGKKIKLILGIVAIVLTLLACLGPSSIKGICFLLIPFDLIAFGITGMFVDK